MVQPKSKSKKRQRPPSMMKYLVPGSFLVVCSLPRIVHGQTSAFTRQTACPNDPSLRGYTSIPSLNDDMAAELQRIADGADPPNGGYDLILCPGEIFDATGGNVIRPVIDQVNIACGGPRSVDPVCIIDGNREQLVIEDSTIPGYSLTSITMEGLTFNDFTRGVSATLTASSPTIFTCIDCIWQDFDDSDFAVDLQGSMTMRVEDGTVRSSDGNMATASINEAIFNVAGGNLEIEGLLVENITTRGDIIRTSSGSVSSITNATFRGNTITRNLGRTEDGGTTFFNEVVVERNARLDTVFLARGVGSSLQIANTTVAENRLARDWTGVSASQGSSVSVLDSSFENNEGIEFGVSSESEAGAISRVNVERTKFINNVPLDEPDDNSPSALVATIGNNVGDPFMSIKRVDFEGNSGFTANFMTLLGGQMTVSQACFTGNSNTLTGFQGKDGREISFSYTYVAEDENPSGCGAVGLELGVETASSEGCFTSETTECQVECAGPIADSDVCLSQVELTDSPSAVPSDSPSLAPVGSPTVFPSGNPSVIPSSAPTTTPVVVVSQSPSGSPSAAPIPGPSESPTSSFAPTLGDTESPTTSPAPTLSSAPSSSAIPTLIPTQVEIPAFPFSIFPTIIFQPTKPPSFRPGCSGKGKGKGDSKGNSKGKGKGKGKGKRNDRCPEKQSKKSSKSSKSGNDTSKTTKLSKLSKKYKSKLDFKKYKSDSDKEAKKIKKSKKSSKSSKSKGKGKGKGGSVHHGSVFGDTATSETGNTLTNPTTNWLALGGVQGIYRTYHFETIHRLPEILTDDRGQRGLPEENEEQEDLTFLDYFGDGDSEDEDDYDNDDGNADDDDVGFVFPVQSWMTPKQLQAIMVDEGYRI